MGLAHHYSYDEKAQCYVGAEQRCFGVGKRRGKSPAIGRRCQTRTGDIKRYETLIKGPDKFAALVPIDIGEDGEAHEWETQWFDSEAEARKACGLPAI